MASPSCRPYRISGGTFTQTVGADTGYHALPAALESLRKKGLAFPILNDAGQAVHLVLGDVVDLVQYTPAVYEWALKDGPNNDQPYYLVPPSPENTFPVGPVLVQYWVTADISLGLKVTAGLDSSGIASGRVGRGAYLKDFAVTLDAGLTFSAGYKIDTEEGLEGIASVVEYISDVTEWLGSAISVSGELSINGRIGVGVGLVFNNAASSGKWYVNAATGVNSATETFGSGMVLDASVYLDATLYGKVGAKVSVDGAVADLINGVSNEVDKLFGGDGDSSGPVEKEWAWVGIWYHEREKVLDEEYRL